MADEKSLYARLGGYDAIAAVTENLLARMMADPKLGRFWAIRAEDTVRREKQLLMMCCFFRRWDVCPLLIFAGIPSYASPQRRSRKASASESR